MEILDAMLSAPSKSVSSHAPARAAAKPASGETPDSEAIETLIERVIADPANGQKVDEFLKLVSRGVENPAALWTDVHGLDILIDALAHGSVEDFLRLALRQLAVQPAHATAWLALAAWSESSGYNEIELRYLEAAREAVPGDAEILRRLGISLMRGGRFDDALACWIRLEETHPDEPEFSRMAARATIERSRVRAGLEPTGKDLGNGSPTVAGFPLPSGPAKLKAGGALPSALLEDSSRFKRTPIQKLEEAVRESPAAPDLYTELARLYLEKDRDFDAERILSEGRKATGDEPSVRHLWEDVVMLRRAKRVALAEQEVAREDTPEHRAHLAEAVAQRDRVEVETYGSRCEREPGNARLRFELGIRLKRSGRLEEASREFTAILSDKEQRGPAACELAECMYKTGQRAESLRYYRLAIEWTQLPAQLEYRKRALLEAGRLALEVRLKRLARRYLGELLQLDKQHSEAAALLERLAAAPEATRAAEHQVEPCPKPSSIRKSSASSR